MDVFTEVLSTGRPFLRAAAIEAARALGLFERLPATLDDLAATLRIRPGRLRALLDVLVLEEVVDRNGAQFEALSMPEEASLPNEGWGRLAEVLRSGTPLPEPEGELLARYHRHLANAGAHVAAEVLGSVGVEGPVLADLGGGAGAWASAWLAESGRRALVVDRSEVLALVSDERIERLAFNLRDEDWVTPVREAAAGVVLLANVLHLFGESECRALVSRAARAVRPGGVVVVKDFFVEEDRSGPAESVWFALNMALHTEAGDVHPPSAIVRWMEAAGLESVAWRRLESHPDAMVVTGRRLREEAR